MFRQLNKLKDKAKRVLDDLSNTLENQLSPRRQPQPIPVRVPVSNRPRAHPLYRNYSTTARYSSYRASPLILEAFPFKSIQPLSQYSLLSAIKGLNLRLLPILRSQKYSSYYRLKLVSSSFKTNVVKVFTNFTFVKDVSKYYNSLTNKYDHMGVRVTMNNPIETSMIQTSVYEAVDMLESKLNELRQSISQLKQLSKIGDLPVNMNRSNITVDFDNLTKSEVMNLFVDHQVNYIPVTEIKANSGLLRDMNRSLSSEHMVNDDVKYNVKVGLESYTLNSHDLSGKSETY